MTDLVTLSEVKTFLKIQQSDVSNDERLKSLITQISQVVRDFCGRDFANIARVEYFDGGVQEIFLKHYPVIKIDSIKEEDMLLTENQDFIAYYDTGRICRIGAMYLMGAKEGYFTSGLKNIEVKYISGPATIPDSIKYGTLEWIAVSSGLKTKTYTTNEGVEATVALTTIPEHVREILLRNKEFNF